MKVCPACNASYTDDQEFCTKDGAKLVEAGSADESSRVGQILDGRYRLLKLLGEGGMGEVFKAEHIYINKKVAIKLLRSEITGNQEAVQRFYQEAQSASNIGHENIIAIEDFGKLEDGTIYLAMEFLEGEALSDILLKEPLSIKKGLHYMRQICNGLAAAHEKGVIHRDMKPENVYIVNDEKHKDLVKILDFGIAKVNSADNDKSLTKTGTIFGTPHYMSPEQAMGQKLDHRTDIYSVGVIMYEVFTHEVPFKAESFMGILTKHITEMPPLPSIVMSDIPKPVEDIIMKAMAKKPEERFQNMYEMVQAIDAVMAMFPEDTPRDTVSPKTWQTPPTTGQVSQPPYNTGQVSQPPYNTGQVSQPPYNTGQVSQPPYNTGQAPPAPHMAAGNVSQPPFAAAPAAVGYQTQSPIAGQTTEPRKSGKGLLIFIILFLLTGSAAGAGWYFLVYNKQDKSEPEKTAASDVATDKNDDGKAADGKAADGKAADGKAADGKAADGKNGNDTSSNNADSMKVESKSENQTQITILTNIDFLKPPPVLKVDGKELGTTPQIVSVKKNGAINILITRKGYVSYKKVLSISPKMKRFTAKLKRKRSTSHRGMRHHSTMRHSTMKTMKAMSGGIVWD